jgi:hypothetical protein
MSNQKTLGEMGITVREDGENGRVCVDFAASQARLELTPEQARALASQLIQTVYQAEVKASLRRTQGRDMPPAGRRVIEGPFPTHRPQPARQ